MANFCTSCGAELREGAQFCHACGAPVAVTPQGAADSFETAPINEDAKRAADFRQQLKDSTFTIAPKINILGKEVQVGKGISFNPFGKKKDG